MLQLIVVMPVYNEQDCIESVILNWIAEIKKINNSKLYIINDGSKDNTEQILDKIYIKNPETLKVIHKKNEGHGPTIYYGYEKALKENPEYIFQVDSDNQFLASDIHSLWDEREKYDFIFGVRKKRYDPMFRLILTRWVLFLSKIIFRGKVSDTNIPFRLMKSHALKKIIFYIKPKSLIPNILISAVISFLDLSFYETPITHLERNTGNSSLLGPHFLKFCLKSLKEIIFFRFKIGSIKN